MTVTATFDDGSTRQVVIDVMQSSSPDKPVVVLTPAAIETEAAGGRETTRIVTNGGDVSCSTTDAWLHPEIIGSTLTVDVDPTSSATDRTGHVSVVASLNGQTVTEVLTVTQHGAIALSAYRLSYGPEGGTQQVTVTLGGAFDITASTETEWLKVTYSAGQLDITAEPNYESGAREGRVAVKARVGGSDIVVGINVSQKAYITLTPRELNVGRDGGVFDIQVETTLTALDIQAVTTWVGVGLTDGGRRMTVSVDENTTSESREGYAHIQGRTPDGTIVGVNLVVHQEAGDDDADDTELTLWITEIEFQPSGYLSQLVMYTSDIDEFELSTSAEWLHIKQEEGLYGPPEEPMHAFRVWADANEGVRRSGTITIRAGKKDYTISVTQKSPSEMTPTLRVNGGFHFEYMDEIQDLDIYALYCSDITAEPSDSWIHAHVSSTTLHVSVSDNMSAEERSGTVTVTGTNANGSATDVVNVRQDAYGGYTINAGYEGVIVRITGGSGSYYFDRYLPAIGTNHAGVYGTSTVSGNTQVDKKHEANYSVSFHASDTYEAGHSWDISFNIDMNHNITHGSFAYHDDTKTITNYSVPENSTQQRVFPAPVDLSFNVSDIAPDPTAWADRLSYYDPTTGYTRYYDYSVWKIEYTPGGDNEGLSGYTYIDGCYFSGDAVEPTPHHNEEYPCTIYIYLRNKDVWEPNKPWGMP